MKKFISITIIASLALFLLQIIWISNTYDAYKEDSLVKIENTFSIAISKEVVYRSYNKNHKNVKDVVTIKYAKDIPRKMQNIKEICRSFDKK